MYQPVELVPQKFESRHSKPLGIGSCTQLSNMTIYGPYGS